MVHAGEYSETLSYSARSDGNFPFAVHPYRETRLSVSRGTISLFAVGAEQLDRTESRDFRSSRRCKFGG